MKKILLTSAIIFFASVISKSQITAFITANPTTLCQGNVSAITASPTGGSYSYQWLLNNIPVTGAVNFIYSTMTGGNFSCIVTDGVYTDTSNVVTVTVNPNPVVSLPPNSTICAGQVVTLCPSGSFWTYQWSTGAVTPCITTGIAGVYIVTVSDVNGCTSSATTIVNVIPLPTAVISGSTNICLGTSTCVTVNFTGAPPFTYSYSTGASQFGPFTTNSNPTCITVSPNYTTTYTLLYITNGFCTGTVSGSATVTVYPLPTAVISGNSTICQGDTSSIIISLTGMPPFVFTYAANGGSPIVMTAFTNPVTIPVAPLATTTYTLLGVADNNCAGNSTGSATVTVNALPNVTITSTGALSFCLGDSVLLSAGNGFSTYQWKRGGVNIAGATSPNFYAKLQGNYRCRVSNVTGCYKVSNMIHVSVPCVPIDPVGSKIENNNDGNLQFNTIESSKIVFDYMQLNFPVKAYRVFNTSGRLIENKNVPGYENINIDFRNHASGFYFLELITKNGNIKMKIFKK